MIENLFALTFFFICMSISSGKFSSVCSTFRLFLIGELYTVHIIFILFRSFFFPFSPFSLLSMGSGLFLFIYSLVSLVLCVWVFWGGAGQGGGGRGGGGRAVNQDVVFPLLSILFYSYGVIINSLFRISYSVVLVSSLEFSREFMVTMKKYSIEWNFNTLVVY